jgi:hypothetical protein
VTHSSDDEWLDRLEQATSRMRRDGSLMDEETAALHEAWTSFSQLLESADQEGPEMVVAPLPGPRRRAGRWMWLIGTAAALAACVGTGWYRHSKSVMAVAADPRTAILSNDGASRAEYSLVDRVGPRIPDADLAWEDPFDDQLTRVNWSLWQAGGAPARRDPAWSYLAGEFQQMSDELAGDAL